MSTFVIEIEPKKTEFDPLSRRIQEDLKESGFLAEETEVHTRRLYKLSGDIESEDAKKFGEQLLVDPIIENMSFYTEPSDPIGLTVDVWPKRGVTDPVGDTVLKGIRDFGYSKALSAASGLRTLFPKIKDRAKLESFAKQFLANELIHDIRIRKKN